MEKNKDVSLGMKEFARAYCKDDRDTRLIDLWLLGTGRKEEEEIERRDNIDITTILRTHATKEHFIYHIYPRYGTTPLLLRHNGIEKGTEPYVLAHLTYFNKGVDTCQVVCFIHGEIICENVLIDDEYGEDIVKAYQSLQQNIQNDTEPPYTFTSDQRKLVLLSGMEDLEETRDDIAEQVAELATLQKEIRDREKREKQLKTDILNLYKDRSYKSMRITAGKYVIVGKTVISNRLDTKRLKEEQPTVAEVYTTPTESKRVEVKKK